MTYPRDRSFPSTVDVIGGTPLVELAQVTSELEGRILAKLDYLNPGFSKKDRIARQIIEDAEADETLRPGQTVVELTSGNTGTGLAIVCRVKGYPFVAVMSRGNTAERARMMRALGAEVVLVEQAPGSTPGHVTAEDLRRAEQRAEEIVQVRKAFRADQFRHRGSFRAHYHGTGPELWAQSARRIQAFCDFVGTGGTFAGCAAFLKSQNAHIQCYIVEPEDAAPLAGQPVHQPGHPIQGGGYAMSFDELPLLNRDHVDGYVQVSRADAIDCARRLAGEEGIFAGFSSGANVAAALQLLQGEARGKTVAVVLCDSGLKYLSTELFPDPPDTARHRVRRWARWLVRR